MAFRIGSVGANNINCDWDGETGTFMQVRWRLASGGVWDNKLFSTTRSGSYNITGLKAATQYLVQLRLFKNGFSVIGEHMVTTAQGSVLRLDPPGSLTIAPSGRAETSLTVTWVTVANATSYEVRRGNGAWTDVGNVLTYTFTGLRADTAYKLSVRALASGYTTSAASSVDGRTLMATVDPPPPPPKKDPGPDPIPEASEFPFLRRDGLAWTAYKADGTSVTLNANVTGFEFDWGLNVSTQRPPAHFQGGGRLSLALVAAYTVAELRSWERIAVHAGQTALLHALITDFDRRNEARSVTLHLETYSAAWHREDIEYRVVPTQTKQHLAESAVKPAGVAIAAPANVTRWGVAMQSIAHPRRQRTHNFSGADFLTALSQHASLALIERANVRTPSFWAVPMPFAAARDKRSSTHTFTAKNTNILQRDYRERSVFRWQADSWEYPYAGAAFESVTGEITQTRYKETNEWRPKTDNNAVWTAGVTSKLPPSAERFVELTAVRVTGTKGRERGTVTVSLRPDLPAKIAISFPRGNNPAGDQVTIGFTLTITTDANEGHNLLTANAERPRGLPESAFWQREPTHSEDKAQDILDAWSSWDGQFARMTMLVPKALGIGTAAGIIDKAPGDVVNVQVGTINHTCLLARVGWRMRGNRPLEATWTVVTMKPLGGGGASPQYILLNNRPLKFDNDFLEFAP